MSPTLTDEERSARAHALADAKAREAAEIAAARKACDEAIADSKRIENESWGPTMSNDETKLPKWAQTELQRLRSNMLSLEKKLQAFAGVDKTKIQIDPYSGRGRHPMYLPDSITVRFTVDGGNIDLRLRDGRLEVSASSPGAADHLSVWPRASNMVWLTFGKD